MVMIFLCTYCDSMIFQFHILKLFLFLIYTVWSFVVLFWFWLSSFSGVIRVASV